MAIMGNSLYLFGGFNSYQCAPSYRPFLESTAHVYVLLAVDLDDLLALELPQELFWPTNASAAAFLDIYDWDLLVLSTNWSNILDRRVPLCLGPYPCSLAVDGRGIGELRRVGDGSLACLEFYGCTMVVLDGVQMLCDGVLSINSVLEINGAWLDVGGTSFHNCSSWTDGGIIRSYGAGSVITVTSSTFLRAKSMGQGGGISVVGGSLHIFDSVFSNCSAVNGGGGISGSLFQCYGSAQTVSTEIKVAGCRFVGCSSESNGGGIAASSGMVGFYIAASAFQECWTTAACGAVSAIDEAQVTVSDSVFRGNMASGAGGGALHSNGALLTVSNISCWKNKAPAGGGGVLYWEGDSQPLIVSAQNRSSVASKVAMMCDESNLALYGPCVASSLKSIHVMRAPNRSSPAYPGLPISMSVALQDAYNQTIASDSSSGLKVLSAGAQSASGQFSVAGSLFSVTEAGVSSFDIALQPAFKQDANHVWQRQNTPKLYFTLADSQALASSTSAAVEIVFGVNLCPPGYILALDFSVFAGAQVGACSQCKPGTYSVDPLAGVTSQAPSCLKCPAGGVCSGGSDVAFPLGEWVVSEGMYILVGCPPGHALLNAVEGRFSQDVQQCVACQTGQYVLNPNSSIFSCRACPTGAICDGSGLKGAVAGSLWEANASTGVYMLVSCPAGYALEAPTLDDQRYVPFCTRV